MGCFANGPVESPRFPATVSSQMSIVKAGLAADLMPAITDTMQRGEATKAKHRPIMGTREWRCLTGDLKFELYPPQERD